MCILCDAYINPLVLKTIFSVLFSVIIYVIILLIEKNEVVMYLFGKLKNKF